MKHGNIYLLWLLTIMFVTSCTNQIAEQSNASVVEEAATKTAGEVNQADQEGSVVPVTVPTPDAKTVLLEIYKEKVEETLGSQLSDGRYVGYWNGRQFVRNGKNYFVAFTEATPPSEIEYPAPEDKVTISQATYEFVGNQWQLKNVQQDVGKFGSNNKAPAAETEKKAQFFSSVSSKYFLALPSFQIATAGVRLSAFELFAFSENGTSWQYLGEVDAGLDNSAGCACEADSTSPIECAISRATVNFISIANEEWPSLEVQMTGTEVGADGKVFKLSDKDFVEYKFDVESFEYKKSI